LGKKLKNIDSNIEVIRIICIVIVVFSHSLLYSGLFTVLGSIYLFIPVGICMAIFLFCSGYVHGLKDEFETAESLTKTTYFTHVKNRFLRIYIGYYIALGSIFIAKLIVGYPMNNLTPFALFLDLTNLSGLLTGSMGVIWQEGWFLCALFWLSVLYPLLRRLFSINNNYIFLIVAIIVPVRILIALTPYSVISYCHPLAWLPEFCLGIQIGRLVLGRGGVKPETTKKQKIINMLGARVYSVYLAHSTALVFLTVHIFYISTPPTFWEYFLAIAGVIILAEAFYRLLNQIDKKKTINNNRKKYWWY